MLELGRGFGWKQMTLRSSGRDITNKFKPKNIMKLSTSIRGMRKVAKNLKISTNCLEIEVKEDDYTTVDIKDIIFLLWAFYMYTQILVFLSTSNNKL